MKRFGRGVSIYLFQSFMRSPLIHLTLFHSLGVLLLCNNVLVSVFLLLMTLIEKNRELLGCRRHCRRCRRSCRRFCRRCCCPNF